MNPNDKFFKDIDKLVKGIKYGIDRALYDISSNIVKDRIANSKELKTGKVYEIIRNGKVKKYHIASKANEEGDATITGKLNNATNFKVSDNTANIGIKNDIKYADFIQKTRQSLVRAAEPQIKKNLQSTVEKEIQKELNLANYGNKQ